MALCLTGPLSSVEERKEVLALWKKPLAVLKYSFSFLCMGIEFLGGHIEASLVTSCGHMTNSCLLDVNRSDVQITDPGYGK